MEEWKTYTLGELGVDGKGSYGIGAPAVEYSPDKYTYLRITDINDDGTLAASDRKSVDAEGAENYILKENDIVFARTGNSTGRAYFYDSRDGELVYAGFLIKFSLDPNKVNPKILKYYTHSKPYYDWVRSFDSGATRGNINAQTFASMPIELPSRTTQDRIVDIMSAIDDKIRNNNRINHNLEEQAQALYKSWFVDFEPFKDGKFVESELGMIPEGWRVGVLGELNSFKRGKNLLSKDAAHGEIPVVAGGMEPSCYHNIANTHAPVITISASGANAGYMRLYHTDVWASDCSYIDSSSQNVLFTYCFLRANERLLRHAQTGAVQPHVKPSDVNNFKAIIAPQYIIDDFQINISSMFKEIKNRLAENSLLAKEREILLPKLMSGEIDY